MRAEITRLKESLAALAPRDREFAASLVGQFERTGRLTGNQWPWVAKLTERATAPKPAAVQADIGNLAGVLALFDKAKQHLKHPAIVLSVAEVGMIRLSIAGAQSKAPGTINVTDSCDFESRKWYGRVARDGAFEQSRKFAPECEIITPALRALAANPAKVAAEHGRLTGRCCFCNIALRDVRSTAVGYGPTCAEHFGLPWGDKPAAFAEGITPAA